MNARQRRSAARRLTHRSRSASVIVALSAAVLVALWIGVESVLAALGLRPLVVSPRGAVDMLRDAPALTGAIAGALTLAGVVLIALALTPARQARHVLADNRAVVVIDDSILAGALSRAAATAARVPADNVRTVLSRRTAVVSITPISGYPVSREAITAAIEDTLAAARPVRAVRPRVDVAPQGGVLA